MFFFLKNEILFGDCRYVIWRDLEVESLEVKVRVFKYKLLLVRLSWVVSRCDLVFVG